MTDNLHLLKRPIPPKLAAGLLGVSAKAVDPGKAGETTLLSAFRTARKDAEARRHEQRAERRRVMLAEMKRRKKATAHVGPNELAAAVRALGAALAADIEQCAQEAEATDPRAATRLRRAAQTVRARANA